MNKYILNLTIYWNCGQDARIFFIAVFTHSKAAGGDIGMIVNYKSRKQRLLALSMQSILLPV